MNDLVIKYSMEQVKVCRICLIMDVKMYDLRLHPLDYYSKSIKTLTSMDLPPYACFECAALITKTYHFREKCMWGQTALYNIINSIGMVTEQSVKQLNRHELNLVSSLSCQSICMDNTINIASEESELLAIKHELTNEDAVDDEQKYNLDLGFFKHEISGDDIRFSSDDDDEPLVLHKRNKQKATKSKGKKKKADKQILEVDLEDSAEFELPLDDQLDPPPESPLPRSRGRPKKDPSKIKPKAARGRRTANTGGVPGDDSNMEEYVNIITLSVSIMILVASQLGRSSGRPKKDPSKIKPKAARGRSSGRPRKDLSAKVKAKAARGRRTANTGGVPGDDSNMEEYVNIITLSREEQFQEIENRKTSSNYLNSVFKCEHCYKGFIDGKAWKHHLSRHEPKPGDVECEICKFRFKSKRHLSKHVALHEKKYACKACPYVSKCTTQAKQHQRWHKGVTYKCQHCDEILSKWTSYLSHVRLKHPSEFICGSCGYSFVSRLGLSMHRTMMHKDAEPEEAEGDSTEGGYCALCDVKFSSMEAYRRHMVTSAKHTQDQDFKNGCRECGETFTSEEQLRAHHRRQHARKRPKNYGKKPCPFTFPTLCPHCPETIENARDYWSHFRRVHPDQPYPIQKNYVCDICGKSFRGNAFLTYHKRTHSEERMYKCAQCPKGNAFLTYHKRTHSEERMYKCAQCPKAFYNRTNLQLHEKTHSDTRPYPCSVCFKAFKAKGALDRHFRIHTGEKPYECEVCGKGFGQSNSRKLHVLTVHLKQPAPYVSRARLQRGKGKPADKPLY